MKKLFLLFIPFILFAENSTAKSIPAQKQTDNTAKIEKSLERDEVITERYKKQSPTNTFLGNAARYMDED